MAQNPEIISNIEILDFAINNLDQYGRNLRTHLKNKEMTIKEVNQVFSGGVADTSFYHKIDTMQFVVSDSLPHTRLISLDGSFRDMKCSARKLANEYAQLLIRIIMSDIKHVDYYVKCIRYPSTLFYTEQIASDHLIKITTSKYGTQSFNWPVDQIDHYEKLHEALHTHMNYVFDHTYVFYSYMPAKKKPMKGIMLNLDNDVFAFYDNRDREYTGGGMLEFPTDYLKMDLFPNIFSRRPMYCYQSIVTGAMAYTPDFQKNPYYNPQDSNVFIPAHLFNPDTLLVDSLDRPFSSFQYWGRAKYKIHRHGIFRSSSYIKIGKMGGNTTESVQYKIHRDITASSTNPVVWNTQIASGGRLGFSLEYNPEIMLFSRSGDVFNKLKARMSAPRCVNISIRAEGKFGTMQTSAGGSLIICKNDFKQSAGSSPLLNYNGYMYPALDGENAPRKNSFYYSIRYGVKNVFYDGMLEGYGILHRIHDEEIESAARSSSLSGGQVELPADRYVLSASQVRRWRQELDFAIGVRVRYTTVYYRWVAVSPHTHLPRASDWHYWASIGLNFIIPYDSSR
ncbi:MAG: lipid A deacylase LpxR family protein [Flavobacteriales bacterium]|nr:lipid A deacylase LpxR family protein [Flavobacteriales bacterium]